MVTSARASRAAATGSNGESEASRQPDAHRPAFLHGPAQLGLLGRGEAGVQRGHGEDFTAELGAVGRQRVFMARGGTAFHSSHRLQSRFVR